MLGRKSQRPTSVAKQNGLVSVFLAACTTFAGVTDYGLANTSVPNDELSNFAAKRSNTTPNDNARAPFLGVYKGSVNGREHIPGIKGVDAYGAWLGRRIMWAEDNQAPSWDNVEGRGWQLLPWSDWVNAMPGRKLVLGVNILPGPVDGSGPAIGPGAHVPVSLLKGAAGDYNAHYAKLAENLVKFRLANAILRLGIEFNGNWFTWRVQSGPDAAAFAAYFRQIVKTMRAVPGAAALKFTWNPGLGVSSGVDLEQAWPGDAYVDYIGLDLYDDSYAPATYPWPSSSSDATIESLHQKVWDTVFLNGPLGLVHWRAFSRRHRTPLAFPEWGLDGRKDHHGGEDNPFFVAQMYSFITDPANNVAWHAYFDVQAPDGHHQLGPQPDGSSVTQFPKSASLFKRLFGLKPDP